MQQQQIHCRRQPRVAAVERFASVTVTVTGALALQQERASIWFCML
jgi:hypothetical protein